MDEAMWAELWPDEVDRMKERIGPLMPTGAMPWQVDFMAKTLTQRENGEPFRFPFSRRRGF